MEDKELTTLYDGRQHFQKNISTWYQDMYVFYMQGHTTHFLKSARFIFNSTHDLLKADEKERLSRLFQEIKTLERKERELRIAKNQHRSAAWAHKQILAELEDATDAIQTTLFDALHHQKLLLPLYDDAEEEFNTDAFLTEAGL